MRRGKISPQLAVIIGAFSVLTAIGLFAGSAFAYFHVRSFLQTALKADGIVVGMTGQSGSYFPVFKFTDSQGQEHRVESNAGSNPPSYQVGDKVQLLYDPNDPTDAKADTFWGVWILPVLLCLAGVFDLLFAAMLVFVSIYQQGRM